MIIEWSYINLPIYVFVGLFAIAKVAQIFMTYFNVTVIVLNNKYSPSWEANMPSVGQYIL